MSDYIGKVIYAFLHYREYKSRCETIERFEGEIDSALVSVLAGCKGGIDYSKERVQTSECYDSTSSPVLKATYDNWDEYLKKYKVVELVDLAYDGLNPIEQLIMEKKYMTGYKLKDSMVYTDPEFKLGRTNYYKYKASALETAAEIMGYTK